MAMPTAIIRIIILWAITTTTTTQMDTSKVIQTWHFKATPKWSCATCNSSSNILTKIVWMRTQRLQSWPKTENSVRKLKLIYFLLVCCATFVSFFHSGLFTRIVFSFGLLSNAKAILTAKKLPDVSGIWRSQNVLDALLNCIHKLFNSHWLCVGVRKLHPRHARFLNVVDNYGAHIFADVRYIGK